MFLNITLYYSLKSTYRFLGLIIFIFAVAALNLSGACAQGIMTDSTLGSESSEIERTNVNDLPSTLIRGGAIRGGNLFHSFDRFNIQSEQGAYFSNPSGVEVILARVTGDTRSNLLGSLGVLGDADLFLINPNGILFGSQFSLDVNGSFLGTTANRVSFPNNEFFSSNPSTRRSLLTVKTPIGLRFDQPNGSVVVQTSDSFFNQGQTSVNPGQTLALIGSGLEFQGGVLETPQANLELGSVAEGTVNLQVMDRGWILNYEDVQVFGDISFDQSQSQIDFGPDFGLNFLPSFIFSNGEGSSVQVQGKNITLVNGSQIQGTGGTINVTASESVRLIGAVPLTRTGLFGATGSDIDAGDITINTQNLIVKDGGRASTESSIGGGIEATGRGGNLTVNATELVLLEGEGETASGNEPSSLFAGTVGTATAGNLTLSTDKLIIRNGSQLSTSTEDTGAGGEIIIDANSVELTGTSTDGQSPSGIFTQTRGLGNAGSIEVSTKQLLIRNGAEVSVSSQGTASAGDLAITASSIALDNLGRLVAESTSGDGGNIILIDVNSLFLNKGSQIATTAGGNSTGGDITIDSSLIIALPGGNNDISANAFEGTGGSVNIDTQGIFGFQVLSLEELRALSPDLNATQLPSNDITAISQSGDPTLSGQVILNTPETDPSDSAAELTERISIPPKLAEVCRAGQALGNGQFANVGTGGLPPTPTSLRSYPAVWHDIRPPQNLQHTSKDLKHSRSKSMAKNNPIIEANGWLETSAGLMLVAPKQASSTAGLTVSGSC